MEYIKYPSKVIFLICFTLFIFSVTNTVSAQTEATEKKWNFLTDVYLMFPSMYGETGAGDLLSVPVDANPGDIFSKLKMAAMLYLEAKNSKWAITSDLVYMNLNQEVTPGTLFHSGEVSAKELIWEPAGLYRIVPFWEIGLGGRLTNLSTDIGARRYVIGIGNPTEPVTAGGSKTWMDPIIITRLSASIKEKWLFQFRGDIGGFGIGSDLTWQLQAYSGYRFGKVFQLTGGYRYLSVDYDKGADAERFVFNMASFGPLVRFGFNF